MTAFIYISGSFLAIALIFAGVRAISIISSKHKTVKEYATNSEIIEDPEYITIKKDLLYNLVVRNQELNENLTKALSNYKQSENEINFILNADAENTKDYNNVSEPSQFAYGQLTTN
ncbi:hypothetical protein C9994_07260 [Marivirga lumbricoides]|uniref:Uncharacterized protein n=1 Tax=Marivirga lumbricoides TaxID=1046115 RepID=A0A2T4DRN0_9BACT|nr:hypothetical protein C9994_07260 [Marivirga lumbricoides]